MMIILTNEILKNTSELNDIIKKEKSLISLSQKAQKELKNLLLDSMQKFANSDINVDSNTSDIIIKFLNDFEISLDLSNNNISALKDLNKQLDELIKLDSIDLEIINNFNITYFETNENLLNNTLQIEQTLASTLNFSQFVFSNSPKDNSNVENKEEAISLVANTEETLEAPVENDNIASVDDVERVPETPVDSTNSLENTLIVSELKGKVFLPYTLSCLNDTLKNNPDKYSSIEDIIEKEYTLPYELFKSPAIARFKEAFKLMRTKEKQSIRKAFDLGMELLFNYNLHPAIISACKNLDELDIYLDYLETNETHKFKCFDIKFEIAPTLKK